MEKQKLGQESAFSLVSFTQHGETRKFEKGMSKRFYAACAAMQGLLSNEKVLVLALKSGMPDEQFIVTAAYQYADELLKQENE